MATSDWAIPTGKAITGATYIKDTDDNIAATIEDLRDWCNNANGTYTDWTLTGLRTDFVDINTAQTITAVKTIDTLGAIDFTGGELRVGGVAVTSSAAELNLLDGATVTTAEINILDGVTSTATELNKLDGATATTTELNYVTGVTSAIQTQINGKASLTGATFTGQVKGITPVAAEDLTRKDYVDSQVSSLNIASGTWTPTLTPNTNVTSATNTYSGATYMRVGSVVNCTVTATVTPTATGVCLVDIDVPVGTASTGAGVVGSAATSGENSNTVGRINYNVIGGAQLRFKANTATATVFYINFQYSIA